VREAVARSTLADANEQASKWADIAAVLVRRARKLYASDDDIGLDLANTVYRAVVKDMSIASRHE
jgi:hypothetical protein